MVRMRTLALMLALACATPGWAAAAQAAQPDPREWLLGQIRLGEALYRDELVNDALARLYRISPGDTEGRETELRLAVRRGDLAEAQRLLAEIQRLDPGSEVEGRARLLLSLQRGPGLQALQQARLLAAAGRPQEAREAYDAVFQGVYPTLDHALEYWRVRSQLPDGNAPALAALQALHRDYPGNIPLRQTLANLLFAVDRDTEALAMLHELAREPAARNAAAQREFDYLGSLPPSPDTARRWQDFLALYAGTPMYEAAQQLQAAQQKLLDDPAWRAGRQGLALLEQGRNAQAEPLLRRALAAYPDDAELLGGLGLAAMRTGRREQALAYFARARDKEENAYRVDKWVDLIASTRYWLTLEQADAAAGQGDWPRAETLYRQAYQYDRSNVQALVGLGDAALARGIPEQAKRYYLQARRIDPASEGAVRGLVKLHEQESPESAIAFLDSLPAADARPYAALRTRLQLQMLGRQADEALARQDFATAVQALTAAQALAPDDAWLAYGLAQAHQNLGQAQAADAAFERLLQRQPADPVARYAHALFLSSRDQDEQALQSLRTVPQAGWDDDMRALAMRLERQLLLARADSLRDAGREAEAVALLERQAPDDAIDGRLADWAQQRQDFAKAHRHYARMLARNPANADARLGQIETWLEQGDTRAARHALQAAPPEPAAPRTNEWRRLANAWAAVGDTDRAKAIMRPLAEAQSEPDALLYRDAARLLVEDDPRQALQYYARALHDNGLLARADTAHDDEAFTRATRADDSDDWLRRSLRSDVEALHLRQNPTLTLHNDFGRRSGGTPGMSALQSNTAIAQAEWPYRLGRAYFRAEQVMMDAGSFEVDDASRHSESFGTCALQACSGGGSQRAHGTGLTLGWRSERTQADIGVTPLGFEVVDIVGGITTGGKLGSLGWSATASRRAMSNSLLSYAGARDPNTGITWGGVRATGGSLGLSWDQGGAHGVWSDLSAHHLGGRNVADNHRIRFMAGYYRRLKDSASERMTLGLNTMLWHYDRDLGGYTLGQGGYYSPQRYFSLSVPFSYARRNDKWSYILEASVSWSRSRTSASADYPLPGRVPQWLGTAGLADASRPGGSSGFGYTARLQLERRLSSHLVLGAGIDLQRADDYAPSRGMLYLRYSFQPWQGNLALRSQALGPASDMK